MTHTPRVQHALEVARRRWPDANPSSLIADGFAEWAQQFEAAEAEKARLLRERRLSVAGMFTGVYQPGYIEEVREGWE